MVLYARYRVISHHLLLDSPPASSEWQKILPPLAYNDYASLRSRLKSRIRIGLHVFGDVLNFNPIGKTFNIFEKS